MKLKKLRRVHADFDLERIERYRDLFAGGDAFRRHVGRYLPKHEQEPLPQYQRRQQLGADEYVNYCGPIGNYFASWLFTSELTYKTEPEAVDDFYAELKEDCNGHGLELDHFLHQRFIDALQDGSAFWRMEFPEKPPAGAEPAALSEWRAAGLGRAVLVPVPCASLINWRHDDDGYVWLVEHHIETGLVDPADDDDTVTETWTVWRRDEDHRRYQLSYPGSKKPPDDIEVPEVEMPWTQGQIPGIPFVELELAPELWIMNVIAAPQLANFRKRAGLSWAIERNCYATPVFHLKDRRKPPVMGTGYYLMMGADEKVDYAAPPMAPFAVIKEYIAELKDEIHRVAQQMARGVDNNNAAAVGRSGLSKQADDLATEIVLAGYGRIVRAAVKRTLDLVSQGRGEAIEHTVGGMQTYHVTDAKSFSEMALTAQGLNIPSVTHHRLIAKKQSVLMLPDASASDRQQIADEIDRNISEESVAQEIAASGPVVPAEPGPPSARATEMALHPPRIEM